MMQDQNRDIHSENFYNNYLRNSYNKTQRNSDEDLQYKSYLIKNFREFLPRNRGAHILDIGIGDGKTLRAMKGFGYENYFGIDIAKELIEKAKADGLACEYTEDTIAFLGSNRARYSAVSIFHVIEHIQKKDAVDFLKKIRESLVEDGVVFIVTPSVQNIFYVGPFWDFTHVNFFTERSLYQLCEAAGFKEVIVRSEKKPINIYGRGVLNYLRFLVSDMVIRCIQILVNGLIRAFRFGIGTINPKILSPNLVCICRK